ncbi:hypothetical protein V8E36_005442 [Tilletia maclaganii]
MKGSPSTASSATRTGPSGSGAASLRRPTRHQQLSQYFPNGDAPPGALSGDASGQVVEMTSAAGGDDNSQTPQCQNTIFIGGAAVNGAFNTGWTQLPGFELKRDITVADGGIVQPDYELSGRTASQVKRLIFVHPGLPRDSWQYINLVRDALICAAANASNNIKLSKIVIAGPNNDLVFSKGTWNVGALSRGPGQTSVSSYTAMDTLVEDLLARYPNQVWHAGHSLGASFVQRYALVKKDTSNDANITFWSGNAGSYAWPTKNRPINPSGACASTYDNWAYGINSGDTPAYRRSDVASNVTAVLQQYYNRRLVVALGLADDGAGDTQCPAQFEGSTHLEHGQNLQKEEQSLPGGQPAKHTFDYVQGAGHEDYVMFISPAALQHLFVENYNTKNAATNTGSGTNLGNGGTKGNTGSGSNGNGSAMAAAVLAAPALAQGARARVPGLPMLRWPSLSMQ